MTCNADIIDGVVAVLQFCDNNQGQVLCKACPKKNGHYRVMELCHAKKHIMQAIHIRHANYLKQRLTRLQRPVQVEPEALLDDKDTDTTTMEPTTATDIRFSFKADDSFMEVTPGVPLPAAPVPEGGDLDLRLSELVKGIIGHWTLELDKKCPDLFAELQTSLAMGEIPFSTRLFRSSANEEHQLVDEAEPDFGVELPDGILDKVSANFESVSVDNPTYPWPSKAHFITSLLFSSPRIPFSDSQKRAVLNWAKGLGATNVPSLGVMKKCHNYLDELVGNPTQKMTSCAGDVFYINNVAEAIAKDYANPLTRFAMRDYPEDGDYFIPEHFFYASPPVDSDDDNGESHENSVTKPLYALGRAVKRTEAGFIVNKEQEIIPTSAFMRSLEDIAATQGELDCGLTASSTKYATLSPNPLCAKANGRMVYTVPLIIFMDDVSGNISKQWNKHHAIYMSNTNLPREMLEKEFFVCFVTSSPHAAPMELMRAMKQSICDAATSGVTAWDCKDNEEVLLIPCGLFVAGDNPMQAEECSHAGLNCNYFCQTCDIGGTKEYKASKDGYNSLFAFEMALKPGATEKIKNLVLTTGVRDTALNSIINTLVELGKKLRKRTVGTQAKSEAEVTAALEREFEELLQGDKLEDTLNPLLGMNGLDMHMDTPTEILHTVLLGVVRYFWGQTVFLLDKAKLMDIFQTRLQSIDTDGLNAPCLNAGYICHYKGSLIGKHFKSLSQVMPFIIYDLVPSTVLNAWTIMGELVVLIWHTKILNTEAYLHTSIVLDLRLYFQPNTMNHSITFSLRAVTAAGYLLIKILSNISLQVDFGSGKAESTIGTNGKTTRKGAVAWKNTRCAKILKTAKPSTSYFHGKSLVASEGDVAHLNSHVGFRQMTNGQLFAFADTLHPSVHLPCLNLLDDEVVVTAADIKCVINLQHNCIDSHYIHLIIPETLRETPPRVTNIAEVRATTVQHMKEKKALKKAGDTLQEAERTENDIQGPLMPAPAFDKPPARPKTAAKSKAKAGAGSSTRGRRATASSRAGQVIAGSSGLEAPSAQQNPLVQSTSLVQHTQGQFTLPTNAFPPLQSFRPPIPHLHHPLQSHFPPAQPYLSAPQPYPQMHYPHPPPPAPYIHSSYRQSTDTHPANARAGVRRQRTYSDAGLGDPTVLTPSRAKRLKTYAKKVAEENDVPERGLFDFIDTGGIYYMLIDLKVCMMKMDSTRKAAMLADVKELLNSKDFKVF
ncbi:uncharacterized protein EDB93DRAFT_1241410 [Suillus bovinus]|uniref:uncharacterized protein n=1 Tax=Suillus bovinus TaxID=48563 RepID=UPI001B87AF15|nr:uncharacterized protein EDB93DRAFT_1241410 [Suillus bovinus]KAG2143512.1 hypothetical protein EDB93DRAFT_1241410 [Suillus bovinus]